MYLLGRILQWVHMPGLIKPFTYRNDLGSVISVRTSPRYTILTVEGKEYFFIRETGKFDGIGAMQLEPSTQPITDCKAGYIPESTRSHALS
jgi:hypothetical protein